jgi:hypothetical protein
MLTGLLKSFNVRLFQVTKTYSDINQTVRLIQLYARRITYLEINGSHELRAQVSDVKLFCFLRLFARKPMVAAHSLVY